MSATPHLTWACVGRGYHMSQVGGIYLCAWDNEPEDGGPRYWVADVDFNDHSVSTPRTSTLEEAQVKAEGIAADYLRGLLAQLGQPVGVCADVVCAGVVANNVVIHPLA